MAMSLARLLPLLLGCVSAVERHPTVAEDRDNGNYNKFHRHERKQQVEINPSAKISHIQIDGSDDITARSVVRRVSSLVAHGESQDTADRDPNGAMKQQKPGVKISYSDDSRGVGMPQALKNDAEPGDGAFGDDRFPHEAGDYGPRTSAEAEKEIKKIDMLVAGAELEADLPDTTHTTPEPYETTDEQVDEEESMLMAIAIGLVALAVIWCIVWVVFYQKIAGGLLGFAADPVPKAAPAFTEETEENWEGQALMAEPDY